MKKEEIDFELIAALSLECGDRFKLLMKLIPKEAEICLKHLASCSIHTALFMKDVYEFQQSNNPVKKDKELLDRFLEKCGCDMKDKL